MAYIPPNANGQATGANSAPVVIASDQWQSATSTTAWTSATTVSTTNSIATSNYNSIAVTMSNTSTMTAGVLTFEVSSDSGTTWFPIALARIDSFTVETTYTLSTVANRAWKASIAGYTNFRVRLSTIIAGTGTATIKVTAQTFASDPVVTIGQATAASLQATTATTLSTGSNLVGRVNISALSGGGTTGFTLISAATTNAASVKASAGTLFMIAATNNASAVAFLKFYNKASAPTVGTDVPVLTFMLPANGGIAVPIPVSGINFTTGISYAITGAATTADTTPVAVAQIQLNGAYI